MQIPKTNAISWQIHIAPNQEPEERETWLLTLTARWPVDLEEGLELVSSVE
jgi:hypothetical protein